MGRAIAHDAVLRNLLKKALQKYLDRSDITEVAVNSPGIVWVEESGGWAKIEDSGSYIRLSSFFGQCGCSFRR